MGGRGGGGGAWGMCSAAHHRAKGKGTITAFVIPTKLAHPLFYTDVRQKVKQLTREIDDEVPRVLHHPLHRDAICLQHFWLDHDCLQHNLSIPDSDAAQAMPGLGANMSAFFC